MKLKLLLSLLFVVFLCQINVIAGLDKLDADLRMLSISLQSKDKSIPLPLSVTYNTDVVDVFIKTTSTKTVKEVIERNNGKVLGTYGPTIVSARIPYKMVDVLHQMPEVVKMESAKIVSVTNTKAKQHIGADKVHTGQNPLPRAFTGKGVLVGILDTGIDFFHKEFFQKDDPTKSRIIAIYDTELNANPAPFGLPYGKYFSKEEIQATINGTSTVALQTVDEYGHGTHVAATAAGLSGIAPDAEIVAVRTLNRINPWDRYSSLSSEILVSMEFVEEIAKIEKKPLVYNMSLGITQGIRDGSDLASQALDELLARNPQTVCVVSAANDGDQLLHWGGDLPQNSKSKAFLNVFGFSQDNVVSASFTLRIPIADTANCSIQFHPTSILNELNIYQIYGINPIEKFSFNSQKYAETPPITISQLLQEQTISRSYSLPNRPGTDCSFIVNAIVHQHVVEVSILLYDNVIEGSSTTYFNFDVFQFSIEGSNGTHLFKNDGWGGFVGNPIQMGFPQQDGIIAPDYLMNLGSFPTLSQSVIVVGAYSNMLYFLNSMGAYASVGGSEVPEGQIAPFSSKGPTADGRVKPDIVAPGHNIISAKSQYAYSNNQYLPEDTAYVANSGTSMSSPVVCGAVALLFEQNPNLTVEEIRALLIKTADKDEFTGTVPNPTWGWGKLNIFAAMQRLIVSVAEQNISNHLTVFPSITNTSFSISVDNPEEANEVFLVNTLGETLEWKKADKLQLKQCEFNVKGLPSGQYYVVVINQKGVQSQAVQVVK